MPVIGLLFVIQVLVAVHAGRTGRPAYWILLIIFLPVAGIIAYLLIEILPELAGTRTARTAASGVARFIDPERGYRDAMRQTEIANTPGNRIRLAEECLRSGRFAEAEALYRDLLTGINATEPDLMLGMARAQFEQGRFDQAQSILDQLRAANPDYRSADGHLLYARALEMQGKQGEALEEYAELAAYYPGQEAKCRYAALLGEVGRMTESRRLFQEVCRDVELMPKHARRAQLEWRAFARRHLAL